MEMILVEGYAPKQSTCEIDFSAHRLFKTEIRKREKSQLFLPAVPDLHTFPTTFPLMQFPPCPVAVEPVGLQFAPLTSFVNKSTAVGFTYFLFFIALPVNALR
ncbi:MAG: hypothetical protein R6V60_03165 [Desulfobacterales bacterium]